MGFQKLDGFGRFYGIMAVFIGFDEIVEDIEALGILATLCRRIIEVSGNPGNSPCEIGVVSDSSKYPSSYGLRTYLILLFVCADELNQQTV